MRSLVVLAVALVALSSTAHADALDLSIVSPYARAQQLRHQEQDAIIVRNVGMGITALGVVSTVVGAVLAVQNIGDIFGDGGNTDTSNPALYKTGIGLFAAGQVAATAGIAMWATGGAKASDAKRAQISFGATSMTLKF